MRKEIRSIYGSLDARLYHNISHDSLERLAKALKERVRFFGRIWNGKSEMNKCKAFTRLSVDVDVFV